MNLTFALVGDVHGAMHAMVKELRAREKKIGRTFDFVAQVGDFEPHRHDEDLRSMAAPAKYKEIGDFPDFVKGWGTFPWPVYFIGGNHEPYGWLEQHPHGAELIRHCVYLGRVGKVEIQESLMLAGLSGVFVPELYTTKRPPLESFHSVSNKSFIGYTEDDVDRILEFPRPDILLLHEWPEGLTQDRKYAHRSAGSAQARLIIELLRPRLVACGHMHRGHHDIWTHDDGSTTELVCLAHIRARTEAVAAYQWDGTTMTRLDQP